MRKKENSDGVRTKWCMKVERKQKTKNSRLKQSQVFFLGWLVGGRYEDGMQLRKPAFHQISDEKQGK